MKKHSKTLKHSKTQIGETLVFKVRFIGDLSIWVASQKSVKYYLFTTHSDCLWISNALGRASRDTDINSPDDSKDVFGLMNNVSLKT